MANPLAGGDMFGGLAGFVKTDPLKNYFCAAGIGLSGFGA